MAVAAAATVDVVAASTAVKEYTRGILARCTNEMTKHKRENRIAHLYRVSRALARSLSLNTCKESALPQKMQPKRVAKKRVFAITSWLQSKGREKKTYRRRKMIQGANCRSI